MSIICLIRGLSLIGIGAIWLLSLVCLLMRITASFLRNTDYLNFLQDHVSQVYNHATIRLAKGKIQIGDITVMQIYSDRYSNTDWQFEMFNRGKDNEHDTGFKCKLKNSFLIFSNVCCCYTLELPHREAIPMCAYKNVFSIIECFTISFSQQILIYFHCFTEMSM